MEMTEADWEVVEGFQREDEEVQKRFYWRCADYFRENRKAVANLYGGTFTLDDLFQDAFIKLWEEMRTGRIRARDRSVYRLDRQGMERRMTASLLTFLMAIAKYRNLEMLREEDFYEPLQPGAEYGREEGREEEPLMERIVCWCVNNMPSRCKDILTKYYYEGLTLDEILAIRKENVSKDGLKTGKSKCMTLLKKEVREICGKYKLKVYEHI